MAKSFVQKVIDRLKGGDEDKLNRFEGGLNKYFEKQIEIRKNEIEDITERIADAKEERQDIILNVDLSSIQKGDDMKTYLPDYVDLVMNKNADIAEFEAEIATKNAEIAALEAARDQIAAS